MQTRGVTSPRRSEELAKGRKADPSLSHRSSGIQWADRLDRTLCDTWDSACEQDEIKIKGVSTERKMSSEGLHSVRDLTIQSLTTRPLPAPLQQLLETW